MPGGLLNIAAYGSENIILTGNPTKTFFSATYKKYTNFGLQRFRLDYDGQRSLSYNSETEMTFKIPRYAEMIWDTYLVVNLPDIWSPFYWNTDVSGCITPYEFKWIKQLGSMMIHDITIYSGSNILAQYSGEYMSASVERDDGNKKILWKRMIGDLLEYTSPEDAYQNGNFYPNAQFQTSPTSPFSGSDVEPSIRGRKLYVPLEAWFCHAGGKTALPLVSMQYQEVFVKIRFRAIKDLYTILDVTNPSTANGRGPRKAPNPATATDQMYWFLQPPQDASGVILSPIVGSQQYNNIGRYVKNNNWNADIHLMATYVFLSNDERRLFASKKQTYLVKEIHQHDFLNVAGSHRADIPSRDMVASYLFRFRRSDAHKRNEWYNYTNWSYDDVQESQLNEMDDLCAPIPVPLIAFQPYGFRHTAPMVNSSNIRLILLDMGILCGSQYRENVLNAGVYNYIEKWVRTEGLAKDGLYMYNFAVNSNKNRYQPSGAQNTNKWQYVTFEFNTIEPPVDPSNNNVQVLCDPSGAIIGVRKDVWRLNKYNYDLRDFEERYNMIISEGGRIGLLNAR